MPAVKPPVTDGRYDIYPAFAAGEGKIFRGLSSLAGLIAHEKIVILDGFEGILFDKIKDELDLLLRNSFNIAAQWISSSDYLKPEPEIDEMIYPFIGGTDPLFGTRCDLSLIDLFDQQKLKKTYKKNDPCCYIIYGIGASLISKRGMVIYFDLPRNELQFRARAGTAFNIGASKASDARETYKRFYFVDWVMLKKHKQEIIDRIDILADGQRHDDITWIRGADFRQVLNEMSCNPLRVRPWFEPGAWGGTWIKDNIPGLSTVVPNYAWSFELITPENGIIIESSGLMVEFSFDFLMAFKAMEILGENYERFGTEFPVRFDFLDTFDGGNLSIQCHPLPEYMRKNFGENFTQEETYYILDKKENAGVYLGFQNDIEPESFRQELEKSCENNIPVSIEDFVQYHTAKKHDLFLIPSGTIHGSGRNNLVLEISSTPYIFTFKMYDWLRPDLDGKPRPLNIERGMDNLLFERKGEMVADELICKPVLIDEGPDWQKFHLPTHATQLFDIVRYHFRTSLEINTENRCHILSLVEGKTILVEAESERSTRFCYAETFIIPAAAQKYLVINESTGPGILVCAFVK